MYVLLEVDLKVTGMFRFIKSIITRKLGFTRGHCFAEGIVSSNDYYSVHLKKSGIAYVLNSFELNSTQFAKDAHVWGC